MEPAIYIETDIPPGVTLDEWRARTVRPSRTRVPGRLRLALKPSRRQATAPSDRRR